jgi:predicted RNA-binding Zn-ribbon protein involved in translation (DUF1610 family)
MAYLVKCSLCGRNVSNECEACPNCGHNIKRELQIKEREKKNKWKEQGLCEECGNNEFMEVEDKNSTGHGSSIMSWTFYKMAKCASCGWIDRDNCKYQTVSADKMWYVNELTYNQTRGHGTWWGLRKKKLSK